MSEPSTARANTAASSELLAPGTRIDKYEVVHRIAFGGMAEIYLARAVGIQGFEKYVVLKRILPQHAANEEFVRMFLKEARLAASLDHANIAHVYDIGETRGSYFFTMEYLHGEDLRWIMHEALGRGMRLPLEHAIEIVSGAAAGLNFAHEKRASDGRSLGIVHRDISPANVFVTYDGGVKVVDFGIAKMTADPDLSRRYSLKGKLAYMSPEQLHNQPVDRRSDVFALGIVLYEITTHSRLFKAATEVDTMRVVLEGVVPRPCTRVPDYPPALERIVLRALEKEPDKRYQSARDLQLDLEEFARNERLQVSSAALAEWMEGAFGPKRELWHTLPAPATRSGPPASGAAREPTAPTSLVGRADVRVAPDVSVPVELPAPARKPWPRWTAALAALALVAVAGTLWLERGRLFAGELAQGGGATPVVLVAEQGNVAVERGAPLPPVAVPIPPSPAAVAPTSPVPAPVPPETAAGATERPTSHHARLTTAGRGGTGESFSAAFARREGDIRRCFVGHTDDDAAAAPISLRFEVGRDGHVGSVAVLPAAVGASPLGACLAKVGQSTVFAAQPEPLTFRIPLTVQRQGTSDRP